MRKMIASQLAIATALWVTGAAADDSAAARWNGLYAGLGLGADFGSDEWKTTSVGPANVFGVGPNAKQNLDQGFGRIGAHIGWNAAINPSWVAGAEVDGMGIFGSNKVINGIPGIAYTLGAPIDSVSAGKAFDASIRGRLGYATEGGSLIYGTAGVAFLNGKYTVQCPSLSAGSWCGVPERDSTTKTFTGWTAGLGVEQLLSEHVSVRAEYRYADYGSANVAYFGANNAGADSFAAKISPTAHILTFGITWHFGEPAPQVAQAAPMPTPPAPTPTPAPAPEPPKQSKPYLVFFDFDKATVTPEGRKIIEQAAADFKQNGKATIVLTGHTDTMGTADYNMKLSLRRARAVQAALAKLGISKKATAVIGKGKSEPLVQTGDGVREPQNRRVEIVLK